MNDAAAGESSKEFFRSVFGGDESCENAAGQSQPVVASESEAIRDLSTEAVRIASSRELLPTTEERAWISPESRTASPDCAPGSSPGSPGRARSDTSARA